MILLGTGWGEGLAAFDRSAEIGQTVFLVLVVVVAAAIVVDLIRWICR